MPTPGPIWIVGASRSGTTLVHAILDRTPGLHMLGETHYFDDLRPRIPPGPLDEAGRRRCEDYFLALAHRPYGHGGDPRESPLARADLRSLARRLGDGADAYLEAYARLRSEAAGKQRWGEKTPRHVYCIADLLAHDPSAHVVCMIRDPRAVVLSYRDWVRRGHDPPEALRDEQHRRQLQREARRVRASYHVALASLLWRASVLAARDGLERFGPRRVRLQRYEDLVQGGETAVRRLLAWLEIDFVPEAMEVPLQNSSFDRFGADRGLSSLPLERWRTRLRPGEIAAIELCCGRVLSEAGYTPLAPRVARSDLARALATLPGVAARAAWANRHRVPSLPAYAARRLRWTLTRSRAAAGRNP